MSITIRPLEPQDLPNLSQFLTTGFRTALDAEFAAPDVLAWKYFDPQEVLNDRPRSLVALADGKIVGHLGFCYTRFRDTANPDLDVPTLHMIDWLGSPEARGVGVRLMRQAGRLAPTQYGIGGTDAARQVGLRSGYERVVAVPIYRRVLRQGHALRKPGQGATIGLLETAKGMARNWKYRPTPSSLNLQFRPVKRFGAEVESVVSACQTRMIFTSRPPGLLNHLLRHPRGRISGGLLILEDQIRGFGLLAIIEREGTQYGQVVECFVDAPEAPGLLSAALGVLTQELHRRRADVATAFGGTPWMTQALRNCGFYSHSHVNLYLRDPDQTIPRDAPFHVSPVEADYAFT